MVGVVTGAGLRKVGGRTYSYFDAYTEDTHYKWSNNGGGSGWTLETEEKFTVGMGFNEKESYEIVELFGKTRADFDSIQQVASFLKEKLELAFVVVHPVKVATGASDKEEALVNGPYCAEPKLTTGAGDNFNAGFLLGRMLGLELEECLYTGTANSGFYVRNARSARYEELCDFVQAWGEGKITE